MAIGQRKQIRRKMEKQTQTVVALARMPEPPSALMSQSCVIRGRLVGYSSARGPLVDFEGNQAGEAVAAASTVDLQPHQVGEEVTLAFLGGDAASPVITGILRGTVPTKARKAMTLTIDGERLEVSTARELVLRCGKASITMRSDGTIELRGTNLLSRSSGTNRVQGGSISLN